MKGAGVLNQLGRRFAWPAASAQCGLQAQSLRLPEHLLEGLEIARLCKDACSPHGPIQHAVGISAARNSQTSWHDWKLPCLSRSVNGEDSRPLCSPDPCVRPVPSLHRLGDCGTSGAVAFVFRRETVLRVANATGIGKGMGKGGWKRGHP